MSIARFPSRLGLVLPFAAFALLSNRTLHAAAGDLLATIPDPSAQSGAQFGASIATDGSTVAVGSPGTTTLDGYIGAVYLYDTSGVLQRRVTAPVIGQDERFGAAVAVLGSTLLVGAPGNDSPESNAGAVYAMDGSTTLTLQASSPEVDGVFGESVAILSNLYAVGSPSADFDGSDEGAVHVFELDGNLLMELYAPEPFVQGWFGRSIAVVGENLLVGAPGQLTPGDSAPRGEAYLFDFDPGSAEPDGTLLLTLTDPGPGQFGSFGESVAAAGGTELLAVIGNPNDPGRALLFNLDPLDDRFGDLLTTFGNPTAAASSQFGQAVAAHDFKIYVGAPLSESDGSVYLFDGDPSSDLFGIPLMTIDNSTPSLDPRFGASLAAPEDARLFVGDAGESPGGAIHLFDMGEVEEPSPSTVTFNVDSAFSDFNVTVFGAGGASFTFQPGISGTITCRIFDQGGDAQSIQIVSADLHMDDVTSDVPFPFQLTGLGAVIGGGNGVPGPPVLIDPSGGFTLFGNQVHLVGTATSDLGGAQPYVWQGGFGLVPFDLSGSIVGTGGVFTIDAPFDESHSDPGTGASFTPSLQAFGSVSLEEAIPVRLSEFSLE